MPYNPGVSYRGGEYWGQAFANVGQSIGQGIAQNRKNKEQRKQYETILGALDPENYNSDTLSALSLAELEGELQARTLKQADAIRAAEVEKQEALRNEAIARMEEMVRKRNAERVELGATSAAMQVFGTGGQAAMPQAVQEYMKRGGSNPKNFIGQLESVAEMEETTREESALATAMQLFDQSGDAQAAQDAYFANGGSDASVLSNQLRSMAQTDRGFEPEVKEPGSMMERFGQELVQAGKLTPEEWAEYQQSYVKNTAEGRPDSTTQLLGAIFGGGMQGAAEPGTVQPIAPGGEGGMPSYATEAQVEAALKRGEIAEGDVIMLNGRRVKVGG